jgi:hypothetical protein
METILLIAIGAGIAMTFVYLHSRYLGFLAQRPEDYADLGPAFDLRTHLDGRIACEGIIYGPTGRVSSRFVADFNVRWEGNTAIMTEQFRYDSGATQNREWRLTLAHNGTIQARADDVVGVGSGRQSGPVVQLDYQLRLPEDAGGHVLSVNDWMYLTENGVIMNRSQFRKFGFKVAELVATMRPVAPEVTNSEREAA